jgi:excisionase family DNA binding protein
MSKLIYLRSLREAAEALGVSIFTLRRLIDQGAIKAINVSARRLVSASEIERVATQGAGTPRVRKSRRRAGTE